MKSLFLCIMIVLIMFIVGCNSIPNEINAAVRTDETGEINGYQIGTKWSLK